MEIEKAIEVKELLTEFEDLEIQIQKFKGIDAKSSFLNITSRSHAMQGMSYNLIKDLDFSNKIKDFAINELSNRKLKISNQIKNL